MRNFDLLHFITTPIVFSYKVRTRIKIYLYVMLFAVTALAAYTCYIGDFNLKSLALLITSFLIVMPFVIYVFTPIERKIEQVVHKVEKDPEVKYWLFSNKVFHLLVIILTYLWLAILLLVASMVLVMV